jgi:hypothetical protein
MNRILIAAVALCALAYAVYVVWLKPGSNEIGVGNPTTPESIATSPASISAPNVPSTAGAPPEPATVSAPGPEKAAEKVTAPPTTTPKAEKAHHASHPKKPAKPH